MSALFYDMGSGIEAFSSRRDGVLPFPVVRGHQVHQTQVAVIEQVAVERHKRPADLTREDLWGYDALVTAVPDVGIAVRTADCIPVLLYDSDKRVIAAIHAGWRGTVGCIVRATIRRMEGLFHTVPSDLYAVIGPGIARASFQVGGEVVEQFREAHFPMSLIYEYQCPVAVSSVVRQNHNPMYGGHHIDLFAANRWLLESEGVLPARIRVADIDTFTDTSFFSARREGVSCGRIINAIRLLR